jgi:NADH-quinone oxidoreductase subunit F
MDKPLTEHIRPGKEALDLKGYKKVGGYRSVNKAVKKMTPAEVQKVVKDSNLKGRGGAGFPTGVKWSFVPMGKEVQGPKYMVANADEMEPGTFKDRVLLEGNPHQLIEGMIVSAYAIQAEHAYIFLRWAYKKAARKLEKAIAEAYGAGYLGKNILRTDFSLELSIHTSAGRYIAGEETALLSALEGRRAYPRNKPPYPQASGLFGRPSVVNNVETLCCVPHIVLRGADWFKQLSLTDEGGTKIYGVSGRVKRAGYWELPMGTCLRDIIEDHAEGMQDGYKLRALLPGGASSDFILGKDLDFPFDFSHTTKAGSRLGTGTSIVLDDKTCPVGFVHNLENFFSRESCGWCTPCREGLPWIERILRSLEQGEGRPDDIDLLLLHAKHLDVGHTFCALAPGAIEPLRSGIRYFKDDFERHVKEKRCPWKREK